jgi:hypothetical protein
MHGFHRVTTCLAAITAAVLLCLPAGASQAAALSPSIVLVLKLVAADRVQPVTGVVVSDDGLVLVPADFVSTPAELIVLDGGTDILGNGRPAQLFKQLPDAGLALLSVAGLKRPAIALSAMTGDDDSLYLEAFPPARQIASGAEPLRLEFKPDTALPYVTGAIIDVCGSLSALAVTTGMQNLETIQQPQILDARALAAAFEEFQLTVPLAACKVVHQQVTEATAAPAAVVPEAEIAATAGEIPPPAEAEELLEAETVAGQAALAEPAASASGPVSEALPERTPASDVIPWWLQLAGLVVLAALAWGIFVNFRKHARKQAANLTAGPVQPASDEPDTVQLSGRMAARVVAPRSGRDGEDELPDLGDLPAGCDGLVLLEGDMGGKRKSRYFRAVDTTQFELVIGRGEADIRIENAAISRRHALLACGEGAMTLADLGSSNGLHINRVPCLPGEVMHVQPGSELCFGGVCLTIELLKRGEEVS